MKYIVPIILVFGLVCCNPNPKTSKSQNEISNSERSFKSEYSGLCNKYLDYPEIDTLIIAYCNGTFQPSDDDQTVEFLRILSQENNNLFPFYYRIFNNVLKNSDGALSEMLPEYCFLFIKNYPVEIIEDFKKNPYTLENYAQMLGYEFYFVNYGTSTISMNYDQFKELLSSKIDLTNRQTNNTYNEFINKIDEAIKNME
jgi:hypothetical protein